MSVLRTLYMPGTQKCQKWVSDTLELELWVFVSHQVGIVIQMQVLLIIKQYTLNKTKYANITDQSIQ